MDLGFLISFTCLPKRVFYFLWNKQHYKMNIAEGKKTSSDSTSALLPGLIGVFLSILE
jgi:hypothetical protein